MATTTAPPVAARIDGLAEFQRALRKADKRLAAFVRVGFREVAAEVATEARAIAEGKGLRESGDLIAGIAPFSRQGGAGVRSRAIHRGFNYPRRLEYESDGLRATLGPAVIKHSPQAEAKAAAVLEAIVDIDLAGGVF